MSQIGVVNVKFLSSVGGLTSGVDAAGKAFKALGGDTSTLRSALSSLNTLAKQDFLQVGPAAGAAKAAFDQISVSVAALSADFRSGAASSGEFATGMAALTAQAKQMAQATADAAAIARENTTAEQDYFAALDRITNAVRNGGLAEDVATRARAAAYQSYLRNAEAMDRQAAAAGRLAGSINTAPVEALKSSIAGLTSKTIDLAVQASGLGSVESLKSAVDAAASKNIALAVEASGLGSVQALRAAIEGTADKTVTLAVAASGLGSVDALKTALSTVDGRVVDVAVKATGLGSVQQLQDALNKVNWTPIDLAVKASGLGSVEALKAALNSVNDRSVDLAVTASGLGSVEALRAALSEVKWTPIDLAVQASGLSTVEQLRAALDELGNADPLAGIVGFADAFAASIEASDSFIAATEGVSAAVEQQATALEIAKIAAEERAAMVARAAEIERASMTATQAHAAAIEELDTLYGAGVLSADAYAAATARQDAALAQADGSAAAAAAALSDLAAAHQRGAAVTRGNMTAQEQYSARVADLRDLLSRGAISQETFSRAVSAAAAEMRKSGTAASDMSSGLAGISSRLNILIGLDVARLFGSIASTVSNTVSSFVRMGAAEAGVIDQTSKLAARLNVTYGEMAGLSLAAEKSGVSMESMKDAMTKADVAFVNAANGSASAAAAFDRIGLSAAQLNGMGTADRFQEIAKSIAALPTEAERAAAATQIFGRSGADLLPLFAGGAEGIARAREEADRLGLSLTNAQGQDVEKMVSSFETAQNAIQGVVQQVTAYLSPAVTGVVEQFNTFIGDIGGANIGAMIGEGILAGAEYLAGVADWLVANFGSTFEYFSQIGAQWSAVGEVLNRVGAFLSGVFNTAAAAFRFVILGITGSFQTLATIAQQIGQYLGFDTSSLDVVVAAAKGFNDELQNGINQNLTAAKEGFGTALFGDAEQAGQAIARPFTSAVQTARDAARQSATAVDTAKQKPIEIEKTVEIASINEALKGIDSRSSEGVSEMFRLMRGQGGDVQHRQLAALEQIADNTSGGDDTYPFALGY